MPQQSERFKQARRGKALETLPVDMQNAIANGNHDALLVYIESRINGMNIPPAQKTAFIEIFKLVLLSGG